MRIESWRNGFSQAAVQAVKSLIDDNAENFPTAADVKILIAQYLSNIAVNPGTDTETFAYQWAEWLEDGAVRKVTTLNDVRHTNNCITGLCPKPACTPNICQRASRTYRRT